MAKVKDNLPPLTPAPWATKTAEETPAISAETQVEAPAVTEGTLPPTEAPATPAIAPVADKVTAPEVTAPVVTEETVTVTVTKAFKLRTDHHSEVQYQPGVQEMSREHAEHWYAAACGVKVYTK